MRLVVGFFLLLANAISSLESCAAAGCANMIVGELWSLASTSRPGVLWVGEGVSHATEARMETDKYERKKWTGSWMISRKENE